MYPRTNKDLDPVPPDARKWGVTSFVAYWISDAFNAATWQFGASVVALGLTWRESVAIVAISFFIISIVVGASLIFPSGGLLRSSPSDMKINRPSE